MAWGDIPVFLCEGDQGGPETRQVLRKASAHGPVLGVAGDLIQLCTSRRIEQRPESKGGAGGVWGSLGLLPAMAMSGQGHLAQAQKPAARHCLMR